MKDRRKSQSVHFAFIFLSFIFYQFINKDICEWMAGGGVCTLLLSGDRWCQIAHPANNLGGESRNTIMSIYLLDKINPI